MDQYYHLHICQQPAAQLDSSTAALISQRYIDMGYHCPDFSAQAALSDGACRLVARQDGQVQGTLLLRHDGTQRLWADETYPLETQRLRRAGSRLLEVGSFAASRNAGLAVSQALIRATVSYAQQHGFDCLLMEVNPRHQRFYRHIGFAAVADHAQCQRAGAASVLMSATLSALLHLLEPMPRAA